MKRCTDCHKMKPLSEFHIRRRNPDGHTERCKICNRAAAARWLRAHPKHAADSRKAYAVAHRERCNAAARKWKKLNPKKRAVQAAFYKAQRSGDLVFDEPRCTIRTCRSKKVEAHHSDYSKPYDVIFLCNRHHKAWHHCFIAEE